MISVPFSGNKKTSYKKVKAITKAGNYKTVYEPFGGSCVLSVNLFNDGIVERAVVNDYDRYFDLYPEYLDLKDLVVDECYKRGLRKVKTDKDGHFYEDDDGNKVRLKQFSLGKFGRNILQSVIGEYVPEKYWKHFLGGTNFAWGVVKVHKKINLTDFNLFCRQLETTKQREYLDILNQLEVENLDWHDFLDKHEEEINENCLLILDPPYIETSQSQYEGEFSYESTKELIKRVTDLGCDFIFFNQDVNKIEELLYGLDYTIDYIGTPTSYKKSKYREDVMAYVKNGNER